MKNKEKIKDLQNRVERLEKIVEMINQLESNRLEYENKCICRKIDVLSDYAHIYPCLKLEEKKYEK